MGDISRELKEAIEARMLELGMSPNDLAAATGLTLPGLANVRRGLRRDYQVRTKRAVTAALGWTPDSIDRLLASQPARLVNGLPEQNGNRPPWATELQHHLEQIEERLQQVENVIRVSSPSFQGLAEVAHANAIALKTLAERVSRLEARKRGQGGA